MAAKGLRKGAAKKAQRKSRKKSVRKAGRKAERKVGKKRVTSSRGEKAGKAADRPGKVESDRSKYDRVGKDKQSKGLRDIPTGRLKDYVRKDNDAWRSGKVKLELDRRQKERDKYDRDRKAKDRDRGPKDPGMRGGRDR